MNRPVHPDTLPSTPKARLPLLVAAWVIFRRDFLAVLKSRTFFFFWRISRASSVKPAPLMKARRRNMEKPLSP